MNLPAVRFARRVAGILVISAIIVGIVAAEDASSSNTVYGSACGEKFLPDIPDVRINSKKIELAPVEHCKISGVIGSEIAFELLLPKVWNGKFVMGGNGGFAGSVQNVSLLYGSLQSGYATVATDTGHQAASLDASWALDRLDRLVNFGHAAVHRTAVTARALIEGFYNREISHKYFIGCSRGGGQGLMEAQRYPYDFDAIVSGAPSYDWIGLAAASTQITKAMYPDPSNLEEALVTEDARLLIARSYLERCDDNDGVADGILDNPLECDFDVNSLLCKDERTKSCLTKDQLAAVRIIYDGPKDSKGRSLFYGFPFGGETAKTGWHLWMTGGIKHQKEFASFQAGLGSGKFKQPIVPSAHYGFGNGIMKYFIYNDPDWSYQNYDYSRLERDAARVAQTLSATNPDLGEFRENGGKLLMFHGWSDSALPATASIAYYNQVLSADPTAAQDVRLFVMPGVDHCLGGDGPSWVNFLTEIDKWYSTGVAPDQVEAFFLNKNKRPEGSRLICAYPNVAKYAGTGSTKESQNYSCKPQPN